MFNFFAVIKSTFFYLRFVKTNRPRREIDTSCPSWKIQNTDLLAWTLSLTYVSRDYIKKTLKIPPFAKFQRKLNIYRLSVLFWKNNLLGSRILDYFKIVQITSRNSKAWNDFRIFFHSLYLCQLHIQDKISVLNFSAGTQWISLSSWFCEVTKVQNV